VTRRLIWIAFKGSVNEVHFLPILCGWAIPARKRVAQAQLDDHSEQANWVWSSLGLHGPSGKTGPYAGHIFVAVNLFSPSGEPVTDFCSLGCRYLGFGVGSVAGLNVHPRRGGELLLVSPLRERPSESLVVAGDGFFFQLLAGCLPSCWDFAVISQSRFQSARGMPQDRG